MPVISRPTMSAWIESVPSKVKIASMSAKCRATSCSSRTPLPPKIPARVGDHLSGHADEQWSLASGRHTVREPAVPRECARPPAQQLHRCDIGEHPRKFVLHKLKAGDRFAELLALHGVVARELVGRHRQSDGSPRHRVTRARQHLVDILERVALGELVFGRHAHAGQFDLRLPRRPQRGLASDHLGVEARRPFLHNVAADLAVLAPRPHYHEIGKRRVADPTPRARRARSGHHHAARWSQRDRVRAVVGLSQRKRPDLLDARHRGSQRCRCSAPPNRPIVCMARNECTPKNVPRCRRPAPTPRVEADSDRAQARAAVALDHAAGQVEAGHLRDQLERELRGLPPAAGMRRHFAGAEVAQAITGGDLLVGKQLVRKVEIDRARGRLRYLASNSPGSRARSEAIRSADRTRESRRAQSYARGLRWSYLRRRLLQERRSADDAGKNPLTPDHARRRRDALQLRRGPCGPTSAALLCPSDARLAAKNNRAGLPGKRPPAIAFDHPHTTEW